MTAQPNHDPIAFTRLRLVLAASQQPWSIPIDYCRHLRTGLYQLFTAVSPDLAEFLHTGGFTTDLPAVDWPTTRDLPPPAELAAQPERFKLFCYSSLIGQGSLQQGRLTFSQPVIWFFATPLRFVADTLTSALRQTGLIRVGRTNLNVLDLRTLEEPAATAALTAELLSPLVISATMHAEPAALEGPTDPLDPTAIGAYPACPINRASRRRYYLTREDSPTLTEARLRANLLAKHRSLFGVEPADPEFRFIWTPASDAWPLPARPTRLVRLSRKNGTPIRVRGNLGAVTISGTRDLLRLALHTGLGQHNASGMGFLLPRAESQLLRI